MQTQEIWCSMFPGKMDIEKAPRRGRPPSGGREQILTATLELLRERGVARTTTKDIAARAGVSEGSIFYHFGDRSGVLLAVFQQVHQPLTALREAGLGDLDLAAALDRFIAALETFLGDSLIVFYAAHADIDLREPVHKYLSDNQMGPHKGVELLGGYLAAAQQRGEVRAGIDTRAAAFMILGTCQMRMSQMTLIGNDRGLPTRKQVVENFMAMLAP
ncbi:TetR/AcrR family transcriptional regulator [Antrihabitans sp. YC2-6]|uniref:TetR/AcrR family transcriptional regulator n=1 Tax=Antrihabitans sp. YC2-6 TaxID=2799498 RepID=UPI0018F491B2|nr:TetR/AcrR family transcriptional regulator [Antrihabitans sp. YC2-6]MBJ8346085.1 TetR/AcrR family transcriptional regulator [Antrihabitans sp. YC2-6]